jgi:O-antigen/teichoic acid export membrane protein
MVKNEVVKHVSRGAKIVSASVLAQFTIGFIVQVILARTLEPSLFGEVAFAASIGLIFNGLTNSAGDKYIIHGDADPHEILDNVFTFELALSIVFIIIMFFLAPFAMEWADKPESTLVVQILAFSYFYNPLSKPRCLFERDLDYYRAKYPLILAQVLSAFLTIYFAFNGLGLWSLVFWRMSTLLAESIILWMIASYRPKIAWDWRVVRGVLSYGSPLMMAAFLHFILQSIPYYVINVFDEGSAQSGYFWLAFQFSFYFMKIREVLYSVLFPIFSRLLDNKDKTIVFMKITKLITAFMLPPTITVVFFSEEIILFLFGEKWLLSVLPFQLIFITILIRIISSNLSYYFESMGTTRISLITVSLKLALLLPLSYVLTQEFGINGTSLAILTVDFVTGFYIYQKFVKGFTGKGFFHFFLMPLLLSGLSFLGVLVIGEMGGSFALKMAMYAGVMVVIYRLLLREAIKDTFKVYRANIDHG